jgi:hypothetical protein
MPLSYAKETSPLKTPTESILILSYPSYDSKDEERQKSEYSCGLENL